MKAVNPKAKSGAGVGAQPIAVDHGTECIKLKYKFDNDINQVLRAYETLECQQQSLFSDNYKLSTRVGELLNIINTLPEPLRSETINNHAILRVYLK